MMANIAIFAAATVAAVSGLSLLSDLFLRNRLRVSQRLDSQFKRKVRDKLETTRLFQNLDERDVLRDDSLAGRFRMMVEQSGLEITPQKLATVSGAATLGVVILASLATGSILFGIIAAPAGGLAPILFVNHQRKKRLQKLLEQLPDAYDLMARAVRAGNTFWKSVLSVSDEFEDPIATELAYCHEMQNLGLPSEAALRELARRTGLIEIKILVEAVSVQEQTGGNLGEILDKLAQVVRERFRIWGNIRSLTAEGRMQAFVLLALAPAMFLILLCINYDYARVLIDWNNSLLLIGTAACEGLGWLWIRRIVNFDF